MNYSSDACVGEMRKVSPGSLDREAR